MKYKVGDKVRVRKDLEVGKNYCNFNFNYDMAEMRGKTVTIERKYDDCYWLKETSCWWTDEMLEPVEDIIEYKGKKYDFINAYINVCGDEIIYAKEHKEEILAEEEKEYLRNVIKYVIEPTCNEIVNICKVDDCINEKYFILFEFGSKERFTLPYFKDKRMYKGMELDKEYTLEELGLN